MFFDDNPEFLETSTTASSKRRLNLRHIGIIEENEEILRGSSVVDIASHDGRWSYAALHAGATHVTGVEGRRHLIDATRQTFDAKAVPATQYTLIQGDVHETLFDPEVKCDVVLCLGFLYHTARYVETDVRNCQHRSRICHRRHTRTPRRRGPTHRDEG